MAAAEQRPQQDQLRVAGVLVLVQQDNLVAAPLGQAHLRMAGRDPGGQRHLIAVVEHLAGGLRRSVPGRQRQQLLPGPLTLLHLPHVGRQLAAEGRAAGRQPFPDRPYVGRLAQVLAQLAGQREHGSGHRRRPPADVAHRAVVGGDDAGRQLPGLGRGDQPHGRLQALPQRMIADQPPRVGMVGADDRIAVRLLVGGQT
jgi:hypothetical protein